jgi:hypothetical protein
MKLKSVELIFLVDWVQSSPFTALSDGYMIICLPSIELVGDGFCF